MQKLKIEYININELTPYENNAKIHTAEQIEQIKKSIDEFGMNDPIGIWGENNAIIEGHGRLMACKDLGLDMVPIIRLDDLTDDQRKAYALAHNKLTMNTGFDMEILNQELESIDLNMSDFGFGEFEIDDIELDAEEMAEDEVPEPPTEVKSKLGDIYQLGEHRLMCGDSTKLENIEKLMASAKADLVLTDPPYGINVISNRGTIGKSGIYLPVKGDDSTDTARLNFAAIEKISKNQIIFGGNYFTDFLCPSRCWLVWDKQNGDNNFADVELAWTSFNESARLYKWLWNGMSRQGEHKFEGKKRVHPTQKPVGLFSNILRDFSSENDVILDCFGGSGSTLIACEQTNRKCYMMEYEPYYIDVIIKRWENLTGKEALKLNE